MVRKLNEVWSVNKCAYIQCFIADGLGPLATNYGCSTTSWILACGCQVLDARPLARLGRAT